MGTLTHEQRQLLKQCGGNPLRLVDPDTNKEYVLLPLEAFQRIQWHSAPKKQSAQTYSHENAPCHFACNDSTYLFRLLTRNCTSDICPWL